MRKRFFLFDIGKDNFILVGNYADGTGQDRFIDDKVSVSELFEMTLSPESDRQLKSRQIIK